MANAWTNYKLKTDNVSTDWADEKSVDFMNFAFYLHDDLKKKIASIPNRRIRGKARRTFQGIRKRGMGFGISGMDEAMEHFEIHTDWKDKNSKNYWKTEGKVNIYPHHVRGTAESCVNFVYGVQDGFGVLAQASRQFNEMAKALKRAKKQDDWKAIKTTLEDASSVSEKATPFLWGVPAEYAKKVRAFADWTGRFMEAAQHIDALERRGLSWTQATMTAGSYQIVQLTVGQIPVLGSLYGRAISWAVDFIPKWDDFMRKYWAERGMKQHTTLNKMLQDGSERLENTLFPWTRRPKRLNSRGETSGVQRMKTNRGRGKMKRRRSLNGH
jgi:hypothetical protein